MVRINEILAREASNLIYMFNTEILFLGDVYILAVCKYVVIGSSVLRYANNRHATYQPLARMLKWFPVIVSVKLI